MGTQWRKLHEDILDELLDRQLNARRDKDVFNLLDQGVEVRGTTWFESCGQSDPRHD